eukprot:2668456-Amphidinium_carterae.1
MRIVMASVLKQSQLTVHLHFFTLPLSFFCDSTENAHGCIMEPDKYFSWFWKATGLSNKAMQ